MRGFGTMLPGFPNSRVLLDEVISGGVTEVNRGFYGYLAAIVFCSVVSFFVQKKMFDAITNVYDKHPYMYIKVKSKKRRRQNNQNAATTQPVASEAETPSEEAPAPVLEL